MHELMEGLIRLCLCMSFLFKVFFVDSINEDWLVRTHAVLKDVLPGSCISSSFS